MNRMANYLTQCLISNEIIGAERKEEYCYGFEIALGKLLNYSALLLIAWYIDLILPSVIFMVFFCSLRRRTGGYHAKTELRCFVGTVGVYIFAAVVIVPFIIRNIYVGLVAFLISAIIILLLAPVNHPNLDLDDQELQQNKKLTKKVLVYQAIGLGFALLLELGAVYMAFAIAGVGVASIMILLAKT